MRLPFFGSRPPRHPTRAWAKLVTRGKRAAPSTPPPSQPHQLIGVVGVGTTETVGGVALTLLSLEQYREGQIVLFRLLRARGRFEREYPFPSLHLAVTPEAVEPLRFWAMGGSGGGMREIEYRLSYAMVPAPASDVSEIVIEVRTIEWERWREGERVVASVDTGPWRYSVRLPSADRGITEGAS